MSDNNSQEIGALDVNEAANLLAGLLPEDGEQPDEQVQDEAPSDEVESEEESADEVEESDSEDEEATEEVDEEPEGKITVKVNGEEVQVTLEELKSGYSRTQDYTRKSQEVAQARKAFEAELQAIQGERQQYAQALQQLAQAELQEPDWDTLRATDPIEYSLQMADYQRKLQQKQIVQAEQQRVAQQMQADQMRLMQSRLAEEGKALQALIPEWSDGEKSKLVKERIKAQGKKLGFSDEELGQVFDHRAVVALHKAALYDELMSKRQAVQPKATPKVLKPSGKGNPGNVDAKKALTRAKTTGRTADIAKAIEFLL